MKGYLNVCKQTFTNFSSFVIFIDSNPKLVEHTEFWSLYDKKTGENRTFRENNFINDIYQFLFFFYFTGTSLCCGIGFVVSGILVVTIFTGFVNNYIKSVSNQSDFHLKIVFFKTDYFSKLLWKKILTSPNPGKNLQLFLTSSSTFSTWQIPKTFFKMPLRNQFWRKSDLLSMSKYFNHTITKSHILSKNYFLMHLDFLDMNKYVSKNIFRVPHFGVGWILQISKEVLSKSTFWTKIGLLT